MKNEELATKIVEYLGGKENILNAENCMTRIRANISDASKADREKLKELPGVLGVVGDEPNYIQVVLGPGKVRDIMNICTSKLGIKEQTGQQGQQLGDWEANKAAVKAEEKIRR